MAAEQQTPQPLVSPSEPLFPANAFVRLDEAADNLFYARDRFVQHLDATALATVERLIAELIVEERPAILDLMASWDSHIPERLRPSQVVGLGLNGNELSRNEALTRFVIHDINADPQLPLEDETFDAVINTVSIDYMTKPLEVFREVGRILKPGGLFLVIFSNRMFPEKVVKIWWQSSEVERVALVEKLFRHTEAFEAPKVFMSVGKPRPENDRHAHLGIPSDPVYAVYADKRGPDRLRKARPVPVDR